MLTPEQRLADGFVVAETGCRTAFPAGHFYSPNVDPDELLAREQELWPAPSRPVLGIDFDEAGHRRILRETFPKYVPQYDYVEKAEQVTNDYDFFTQNSQFSWLDCRAAFVLLREWQPARIIEVGSGFSSLLMADINRRFWDMRCEITCVEPYPRPFLKAGVPGISCLEEKKVEALPIEYFSKLESGDVLFIDSSHVAKTGSDVNYLYFEVLPRLKPGVRVHIHDIFLPNEYPQDWVIGEARSWNEQYVLRALLMYSTAFRVLFANAYAFETMREQISQALALPGSAAFGGGSIWIERI